MGITLEFLDKKHVKFDQGLNFLIFYQGNRGENQTKREKNHEKIRKNKENLKNPGPYFLLNIFPGSGVGTCRIWTKLGGNCFQESPGAF